MWGIKNDSQPLNGQRFVFSLSASAVSGQGFKAEMQDRGTNHTEVIQSLKNTLVARSLDTSCLFGSSGERLSG